MRTKNILKILANTSDGVFAVSTDHKIVFWNKPAQKILGYSAKEVLGKYCNEMIAGTDSNGNPVCSKSCNVMKAIKKKENPENYEILTHSKTGDPIWLNISITCIPGSQPALNTVVHVFRDITKQKMDINLIKEIVSGINNANKHKSNLSLSNNEITGNKHKPKLTFRERQVLMLIAEGLSTKDVSEKLYISWTTVRKHIQNILYKLEAHSKLEAVANAYKNNLI
jgi:PAS domain S-box-containing protein